MRSVEWALSRLPAAAMGSNMNLNTGLERGLAILVACLQRSSLSFPCGAGMGDGAGRVPLKLGGQM